MCMCSKCLQAEIQTIISPFTYAWFFKLRPPLICLETKHSASREIRKQLLNHLSRPGNQLRVAAEESRVTERNWVAEGVRVAVAAMAEGDPRQFAQDGVPAELRSDGQVSELCREDGVGEEEELGG